MKLLLIVIVLIGTSAVAVEIIAGHRRWAEEYVRASTVALFVLLAGGAIWGLLVTP